MKEKENDDNMINIVLTNKSVFLLKILGKIFAAFNWSDLNKQNGKNSLVVCAERPFPAFGKLRRFAATRG